MANEPTCPFMVGEPPGYWHYHRCSRPVKATITTKDGKDYGVCGVHKRAHERHALHSDHMADGPRGRR